MEPIQIAFFGATNSGKSSLVNAIAGQEVSMVNAQPGTTTDPVRKRIELPGLGPCVLVDTAGYGDSSALGAERERLTRAVIDSTDVAVLLVSGHPADAQWQSLLAASGVPVVTVAAVPQGTVGVAAVPQGATLKNGPKSARSPRKAEGHAQKGAEIDAAPVAAGEAGVMAQNDGQCAHFSRENGPDGAFSAPVRPLDLLARIAAAVPREEEQFLTGGLVKAGDAVVLVMPQDSEAPKGRIILPQVQVLRELLDRGCIPVCCQPSQLPGALASLQAAPALVITDSQVFKQVDQTIGKDVPLTSFSVLLASVKGDLKVFLEGARAIDSLRPGDRVLIAEACTHVPDTEDIGRVKIPALLRRKVAGRIAPISAANQSGPISASVQDAFQSSPLQVDIAAGNDFPEDLSQYALIIHCGACVAGKALVRSRIRKALRAGVPITNYGIAIAQLQGILGRIWLP